MSTTTPSSIGTPVARLEGPDKVTGRARYAAEHPVEGVAYGWPVPATVARGEITELDASQALAVEGVYTVVSHRNAPEVHEADDPIVRVLRSPDVAFRGQTIAVVVARTLEAARQGAALLHVEYAEQPHDVSLTSEHPKRYFPEEANGGMPSGQEMGDVDAACRASDVCVERTYRTPSMHNQPMEPHAAIATWESGKLTVYDSNQGSTVVRDALAQVFGTAPDDVHVITEHVGGGFGCKGTPRPQVVLAAMASLVAERPVKLVLPRAQMASLVGYRTPVEQRLRLGASADGRLTAVEHLSLSQTATVKEFVEQAATVSRVMYAAPNIRTGHQVAPLDVPIPSWMRAPGECPGMYALESAMDELAVETGVDPVQLRLRNDPDVDPTSGLPFSSRNLAACLRDGAQRFGWAERDPRPGVRRQGRTLLGSGMASSHYPVLIAPSQAAAHAFPDGSFRVLVNATDIGTGARTVLAQLGAETLDVALDQVDIAVGHSSLPSASVAGGSSGTSSWGWAVVKACRQMRGMLAERSGQVPSEGLVAHADTADDVKAMRRLSRQAYGAQFADVAVDVDTGEVRLRRMLGVFAAGRVLNSRTARSQFVGGMMMGASMALLEHSEIDPEFGDFTQRDLASYHVAGAVDVPDVQAFWVDEEDVDGNPMGSKGIGEIGIVGTAAAVTNATYDATGIRIRDLPITPDKLLI